MEYLHKQMIEDLLTVSTAPAVTIYIPMHDSASPPHITENQIRMKNLVHKAADELRKSYHGHAARQLADSLFAHETELHNDLEFWEHQTAGILLCASPKTFQLFHLPIDTEEYIAVDDQFHLAPVMGLLSDAHEYYVLALAQHDPRVYKGNMYGLQDAKIALPSNVHDALNIDEPTQKSETQGSASGMSSATGWFNGRGGARNPQEADRLRFFRMVDKAVNDRTDTKLPLILAGTEAEIAEYRGLSRYPKILKNTINGNSTDSQLEGLGKKSAAIIYKELVEPEHQAVIDEYQRLNGANPSRVAKDDASIAEAAKQGRIDKLLTMMSRITTDNVRDRAERVIKITFPSSYEVSQRLNAMAMQVWQMSGLVVNLAANEMPSSRPMIARLRY